MRIALISDIHSNLPALRAVLDDLPSVAGIVCLGDLVGYYADANEVCDVLRDAAVMTIRGNHEAYLLGELEPDPRKVVAYRTEWTRRTLTSRNLAWLETLPVEMRFRWGGRPVWARHASPWDEETYLYPDSPSLERLQLSANEVLVVGHTHHPMEIARGSGLVINPGSVGQPRDWISDASYALLDVDSGRAEFRRARYDVRALQDRLSRDGWDPAFIDVLSRSR